MVRQPRAPVAGGMLRGAARGRSRRARTGARQLTMLGALACGVWASCASGSGAPVPGHARGLAQEPPDATATLQAVPTPGVTLTPETGPPTRVPVAVRSSVHLPVAVRETAAGARVPAYSGPLPRNTILFVGDGMGLGSIAAASHRRYGMPAWITFERFPSHGWVSVRNAYGDVPDSASSGTAMATCHKVANDVLSMAMPGDGGELPTVLELLQRDGRATGLVTSSYLTDASPAAFGAHEPSRQRHAAIAADYLWQTRPRVLLGGAAPGLSRAEAEDAGYPVIERRDDLLAIDPTRLPRLVGLFGFGPLPFRTDESPEHPTLAELTRAAIALLELDDDGFFLVVEEERIDIHAHENDLAGTIQSVFELVEAVRVARDWAVRRSDTLIVVTSDHDTGGLTVVRGRGAGHLPEVEWASAAHTGDAVPIYATGVGAERVARDLDNTDIAGILAPQVLGPGCG